LDFDWQSDSGQSLFRGHWENLLRDTRSALRGSLVATCSRALTGILDRDKSCGPLLRSQNKLVDESYSIRSIGMGFPKDLLADDEIAVPMSKLLGSNIVIEVMPQLDGSTCVFLKAEPQIDMREKLADLLLSGFGFLTESSVFPDRAANQSNHDIQRAATLALQVLNRLDDLAKQQKK